MHQPSIAVVIPTRNRGESVAATVRSLLADRGTGLEVIVVDQSDDDATQRAISSLQATNLRYVRTPTRGSSAARNVGIRHARSDLVAMTDDDCEVPAGWLDALVEEFSRHVRIGIVFGNVIAVDHDRTAGFIPACVSEEASLARGVSEMHRVEGMGACMAVRRSVWAQLAGFDETLGSGAVLRSAAEGDFTLRALRAGYFVYQSPRWSVRHHGFRPWEEAGGLVRQYWFGAGAMYAKPVKSGDSRVWALLARLAWRWAFGRSPVAASLGSRPYRWVRLGAFLRGLAAGHLTPIDSSAGHYAKGSAVRRGVGGVRPAPRGAIADEASVGGRAGTSADG
ncbi:MAG: glycosyltransferase family 2 protein [Solirubrobacteraceae bacterium]|jgi:hypothetical protein